MLSVKSIRNAVSVGCDSLFACHSLQYQGQWFVCDLTSVMDLRRVVDFSVGSVFYLLGQRGYFEAFLHAVPKVP